MRTAVPVLPEAGGAAVDVAATEPRVEVAVAGLLLGAAVAGLSTLIRHRRDRSRRTGVLRTLSTVHGRARPGRVLRGGS